MFNAKKKPEEPASTAAQPSASTSAASAAAASAAAAKPSHDPRSGAAPGAHRQTPEEAKAIRGSLDSSILPPSQNRLSPKISRTPAAHASILNPHLFFEGNLKYTGTVTIDCDFRGSITTDDTLIVGPTAKIHAEVCAGVLEISGKVEGNVRAKTRVKIYTGGQVVGNIETPTISMEEGVVFEGSCTRPANQAASHSQSSSQSQASQSQDVQRMLESAEEVLAGST